ncbi:hypothetical protein HPB52_012218 [Rhipicephalus sanguineus]|uniref:Uncharacterized protein n=1 Tax=Rhipicephalus sanguineus TaxID=34632 RepID=A0A9D4YPN8_RHISA|nr:hypothetical protein HPB52_012218 [Rhipicephalus sanguineus]
MLTTFSGDERRSSNNASDVRPSSREYTAYLVGNCPSLCLPVNQLFPNLRYHWSILNYHQVNHDAKGMASALNGCLFLAELSMRHGFLSVISFELHEASPRLLALACLGGQVGFVACNMQRRHSFGLVHSQHAADCCVGFVGLSE